jgi:hypothetical protein
MKTLIQWVMSIIDKQRRPQLVQSEQIESTLTVEEYEFLFEIIKGYKFDGKDLELLYNMVIKLQDQYLKIKK